MSGKNRDLYDGLLRGAVFLIVFFCLFFLIRVAPGYPAEPGDPVTVPYGKNIEVLIEPAAEANLQVLYFVDNTANETYNFHLAGDASNFVIDKKYLHSGKNYSLYLVAFSESNVPSDPSNTVSFTVGQVEAVPAERLPPEVAGQEGSTFILKK